MKTVNPIHDHKCIHTAYAHEDTAKSFGSFDALQKTKICCLTFKIVFLKKDSAAPHLSVDDRKRTAELSHCKLLWK